MKVGALKMVKPDTGKPYMAWWDGKRWQCYTHKPAYDNETEKVLCEQCGTYLTDADGRRRQQ
jgi:hypothetical protein